MSKAEAPKKGYSLKTVFAALTLGAAVTYATAGRQWFQRGITTAPREDVADLMDWVADGIESGADFVRPGTDSPSTEP